MTKISDCIFCEIVKKGCERTIYETKNFFVLIPLGLIAPGHIMIVSKNHYKAFGEMPNSVDNEFLDLWDKVHNLCETHFGKMFEAEYGNWGQSINHAHIHFVPYKSQDYEFKNVIKEMVDEKVERSKVEWSDVRRIYKKERNYVLFKEKGKMILFHTKNNRTGDEPHRTLHLRTFLREKRGVKGIIWYALSEDEKKKDDEKMEITKKKLKFD